MYQLVTQFLYLEHDAAFTEWLLCTSSLILVYVYKGGYGEFCVVSYAALGIHLTYIISRSGRIIISSACIPTSHVFILNMFILVTVSPTSRLNLIYICHLLASQRTNEKKIARTPDYLAACLSRCNLDSVRSDYIYAHTCDIDSSFLVSDLAHFFWLPKLFHNKKEYCFSNQPDVFQTQQWDHQVSCIVPVDTTFSSSTISLELQLVKSSIIFPLVTGPSWNTERYTLWLIAADGIHTWCIL